MVQAFSRVMAVFLAIASVAFLTFSLMQFWWFDAFPDYWTIAKDLKEVRFSYEPGENPTFKAIRNSDGSSIDTSPLLAKVVLKAYRDITAEELQAANNLTGPAIRADEYTQLVLADEAAINKAIELFSAELEQTRQQITQLAQQYEQITTQTLEKRKEGELRRGDVMRLIEQLDLIEVEQRRLADLQTQLKDMIMRVEGMLIRLRNRNTQLLRQSS